MAEVSRKLQRIFGRDGSVNFFGQIGSDQTGTETKTKDLDTIQSLTQYVDGLQALTADGAEPPRLEDFNSLFLLMTTQLKYLFQSGIPDWLNSADERYYALKSLVVRSGGIYLAIQGDDALNINTQKDPLTETAWWRLLVSVDGAVNLTGAQTVGGIKTFSSIPILPASDPSSDNEAARKKYIDDLFDAAWPTGSTYIQFPGDSDPSTLGLPGTWTNVSSELAGDFIRFEGGNALSFEAGQQADSNKEHYHFSFKNVRIDGGTLGSTTYPAFRSEGSWNYQIRPTGSSPDIGRTSSEGSTEGHPINRTVRKWRRTA